MRLVPGRGMNHVYGEEQPTSESCLLTLNVLQTCRALHAEVKTFICARNTLVVVFEHVDYGLNYLRRLGPQQCAALNNLIVQLHLEASEDGSENDARDPPRAPPERQLNQGRISSWTTAARQILSNTTPQTLNLSLFCDTGASDTTLAVLQPLEDFPGVLKDCELRLHHQKNDKTIRTLAWEVASRARGFDPGLRARPFHFFDLPPEIRHHVLKYTDLVTPFTEIYWSANRGFRIARARSRCGCDECDASFHRGCRYLWCTQPSSSLTGRICTKYRSGYSSRCSCWVAPRGVFTTSRAFYREAIRVLYSCNRIIIVPSEGLRSCLSTYKGRKRLDIARFITRHTWPDVLHSLRNIELVFPAIQHNQGTIDYDSNYADLCFAIDHLKAHANIGQITIIIHITTASSVLQGDQQSIHRAFVKSGGAWTVAVQPHRQLLSHFKQLRGMKRFFVHLEWGWRWCVEHPYVGPRHDSLDVEIHGFESQLEKFVMGDDYRSETVGKVKEQPSIWLHNIWGTLEFVGWSNLPLDHRMDYI